MPVWDPGTQQCIVGTDPDIHEISRQARGNDYSCRVKYLLENKPSYAEAVNSLNCHVQDATFAGLPSQRIEIEEIIEEKGLWYGYVEWTFDSGKKVPLPTDTTPDPSNYIDTFSWNVTGEQKLLKWLSDLPLGALSVPGIEVVDDNWQDPGPRAGIGWQESERGYEGVQVLRPTTSFSAAYTPNKADVTDAYLTRVADAVGTLNEQVFLGKYPGTVLFTGARGEGRTKESWSFTFDFKYRPLIDGEQGINCGIGPSGDALILQGAPIPATNPQEYQPLRGWDVIDVEYKEYQEIVGMAPNETKRAIAKPVKARVIEAYKTTDLTYLLNAANP